MPLNSAATVREAAHGNPYSPAGAFWNDIKSSWYAGTGKIADWWSRNGDQIGRVAQAGLDAANGVHPEQAAFNNALLNIKDVANGATDHILSQFSGAGVSSTYSGVKPAYHSAPSIDYLNADLAKHYGMDANAAYSEALQNTAYQRAVADLKAAGLNPVLAAGQVSPAGSFAAGSTLSGGSGAGASGGRTSGMSGKYAFNESTYNLIGNIAAVAGAALGWKFGGGKYRVLTASTGSMLTKQLAQGVMQSIDSVLKMK